MSKSVKHNRVWIKKLFFLILKILCLDLEVFGSSFVKDEGFLSHDEVVLDVFSELGNTLEIDLDALLECYNDVAPLSDEALHDQHVLDHVVAEVSVVLPREARDQVTWR